MEVTTGQFRASGVPRRLRAILLCVALAVDFSTAFWHMGPTNVSAHGSVATAPSPERQFWTALSRAVLMRRFELRERFHYLSPPAGLGRYDVVFSPSGLIQSKWWIERDMRGLSEGPVTNVARTSPSDARYIAGNLLVPRTSVLHDRVPSHALFVIQQYGLTNVRFRAISRRERVQTRLRLVMAISVSANGYPWGCAPSGPLTCAASSQAIMVKDARYTATLVIDPRRGLPLTFHSEFAYLGRRHDGQQATFFYQ